MSLAKAGLPFSFLSRDGSKDDGNSGSEEKDGASGSEEKDGASGSEEKGGASVENDEDEEGIKSPTHSAPFAIDKGILLPSECDTTAKCTRCLQSLVLRDTRPGEVFLDLVKLVDATEVSLILVIQSSL